MNNILYVAIGDRGIIRESILSMHTLYLTASSDQHQNIRVFVYTDLPEAYKDAQRKWGIIVNEVSAAALTDWIGENQYLYKIKIHALRLFLDTYKETVLLVDADTMFLTGLEPLFTLLQDQDNVVLNFVEHTFAKAAARALSAPQVKERASFYEEMQATCQLVFYDDVYKISDDMPQWNSGIIGIHPENAYLLERALPLSDYIYNTAQLRTAEQIALSFVFVNNKRVHSTADMVFHYWPFQETRLFLENYFGTPSYKYLKKFVSPVVVAWIQEIKHWDIPYNILLAMIVCTFRKKLALNKVEGKKYSVEQDFQSEGFMNLLICDADYHNAALGDIYTYCAAKGYSIRALLPWHAEV